MFRFLSAITDGDEEVVESGSEPSYILGGHMNLFCTALKCPPRRGVAKEVESELCVDSWMG